MKTEQLIEQIAEIRAASAATNFMLLSFLEHNGCDPETLIATVDEMLVKFADAFENTMRKDAGLGRRETPRKPSTSRPPAIDWDDLPKN